MTIPVNHGVTGPRRPWYKKTRRWVFPSSPTARAEFPPPARWFARAGSRLFALLLPDDCRLCGRPLPGFSSIPVCAECLEPPAPIFSEFSCARCRTPFLNARPLNEEGLCRLCAAGVTAFEGAWTCGPYDGRLRDLIHLFKYGRMLPLGRLFGEMMARAYPRDQRFEVLVPVPSHWRRRLWRGFDQAEVLARELSRRMGIPMVRALRRTRHTAPQAGLTRRQRRLNMRGCFQAALPDAIRDRRVLLIDDVLTTGATVNAAAAALKAAGAAHTGVFTLARADRSGSASTLLVRNFHAEVSAHEHEH
jgi:ComF family protein